MFARKGDASTPSQGQRTQPRPAHPQPRPWAKATPAHPAKASTPPAKAMGKGDASTPPAKASTPPAKASTPSQRSLAPPYFARADASFLKKPLQTPCLRAKATPAHPANAPSPRLILRGLTRPFLKKTLQTPCLRAKATPAHPANASTPPAKASTPSQGHGQRLAGNSLLQRSKKKGSHHRGLRHFFVCGCARFVPYFL